MGAISLVAFQQTLVHGQMRNKVPWSGEDCIVQGLAGNQLTPIGGTNVGRYEQCNKRRLAVYSFCYGLRSSGIGCGESISYNEAVEPALQPTNGGPGLSSKTTTTSDRLPEAQA